MEGDGELDDSEQEDDDERRDEGELDGGLSLLGSDAAAVGHNLVRSAAVLLLAA